MDCADAYRADRYPSVRTSRSFFAAAVIIAVLGEIVKFRQGWVLTPLGGISGVLAVVAVEFSFWLVDPVPMTDAVIKRDEMLSQFAVFVTFLTLYAMTASSEASGFNAHVRQAFGLIHGHTYIDAPYWIEHAHFEGHDYQLHPPMPSFLLIPFVAICGMHTNQTTFSIVLGAIDVALAWRMFGKFPIDLNARVWLTMFFGAGTTIWFEATDGGSWELTMIVAVLFTLLTLDEILAHARGPLVGLWAACAALSRYDLAFVWPIFVAMVWLKRENIADVVKMAPGFIMAGLVFLTLNEVRYHSMFDQGVFLFAAHGSHLFGTQYIPGNLAVLLFYAPAVDEKFPYFHPTAGGQSILLTSPAFILALRPSFRRLTPALLGIATLIAMIPVMLYFTNGTSQFGARRYVEIYPFLLALIALGIPRQADQLTRILICTSIILVAFGIWHIRLFGFG